MQRDIPVGIGAGLAAAILMLAPLSGSMLGIVLTLFAALPITLATLGWSYRAGLVAAISALVLLSGLLSLRLGLAFGVSIALPAWGLAYLAIAGYGENAGNQRRIGVGTLVVIASVLSMFSALFALFSLGSSYDESLGGLEKELGEALRAMMGIADNQPLILSDGTDGEAFIRTFSRLMLPMSALAGTIASLCGLWLSGRIARISGRLPRPWPDVAALRLPQWSLILLGIACLACLLPDVIGHAGQFLLAAMTGAFAIQGFAVVHYLTRGHSTRPLLLAIFYMICIFLNWLALALIAVLGLIELFFNLRGRFGSRGRPQSPNSPN